MANWAVVIGIDEYWTPEACLKGAVCDALKMYAWLTSVEGGAVPPRNLNLHLGLAQTSPSIPAGVQALPATYTYVVTALKQLVTRSGGRGERFFFYFSGHGLSSRMNLSNEDGVVLCDFTDVVTTNSLTVRSVWEFFQATEFQEQFFIIDACRNIPWEQEEYDLGRIPRPGKPSLSGRSQFVMYATSPGIKAVENQEVGNERGAFTDALFEGLNGAGIAKVWHDDSQEYVVQWDSLFRYVETKITSLKLLAGNDHIQIPRQGGEHGSKNPEFARFSSDAFPDETLEVNLDPATVAAQTQIVVRDLIDDIKREPPIVPLPLSFSLKPRTYSIRATASGFATTKRAYTIDLYGPARMSLELKPIQASEPLPQPPLIEVTKGLENAPALGSIEVRSNDQLAKVELAGSSGRIIATEEGELRQSNLAPGFYRARLVTPEGKYIEQLFELQPGETEEIVLNAPPLPDSTLFNEVIAKAGMTVSPDNTLEPSEAVGPVATAHLTTLLALAGGAVNEDTTFRGYRLRQIGLSSFKQLAGPQALNGIQILFGIEANTLEQAGTYISGIKIRCWPELQPMPEEYDQPVALLSPVGLAQFAWDRTPGLHWLSLQTPDQRPVIFAVTVLPSRLALIVFHRDAAGGVNIYQYLPSLVPGDPNDPRTNEARFPVLQRSELIQRAYLSGHLEEPGRNAEELIKAKCIEPIAGCLGGYILLKLNPKHPLLKTAADNMISSFGELSDSHILQADYLSSQGEDERAKEAFLTALDRGLPVLGVGLTRLVDGIQRYQIQHPRVIFVQDVHENHVPGLLGTAVPLTEDTTHIFQTSGAATAARAGGMNLSGLA